MKPTKKLHSLETFDGVPIANFIREDKPDLVVSAGGPWRSAKWTGGKVWNVTIYHNCNGVWVDDGGSYLNTPNVSELDALIDEGFERGQFAKRTEPSAPGTN